MSLNDYKLNSELLGHTLDVRSVCDGNNSIISGSRDKTVKIWNFDGTMYSEALTLADHSNFVSCVLYMENENWICTASNDSTVCIYIFGNIVPFVKLQGHTSTVCCLAKGLGPQTLVTGSWDKTARVWEISENMPPTFKSMEGHEAAVWSVASLPNRRYVTGSADKLIYLWNEKCEKIMVLKGHTDCVRGVVGLLNNYILSCANDASIKLWNDEGECIKDFHGHSNYIYCLAVNKTQDKFITGSEDSTLRMWSLIDGPLGNAITLPAQSVWSVAFLKNDDIATGSSDGIVRVFTNDDNRIADDAVLSMFDVAVETRKSEQAKELGGVKVNDLPGPESLLVEGTEGQTRIVRQPDGKIFCYQWSGNQWNCLGDVVGASGGSQNTSGKKLFEGKEYDYVFSVDISDTEPPIKLPYNRGEDPWVAAQTFIHKNGLPQVYLDQVANFVIKNSDSTPVVTQSAAYADPFTGESRYVPGSSQSAAPNVDVRFNARSNGNSNSGMNLDPFTGGSSYSTMSTTAAPKSVVEHFPVTVYQTIDSCDPGKVLMKLKEFNPRAGQNNVVVSDDILENVMKFSNPNPVADPENIATLKRLFHWPKSILFPVLDVTRLAVRHQHICSQLGTNDFIQFLVENLKYPPGNQLMAIRCLANMLSHGWGRGLIESDLKDIIQSVNCITKGSANLEVAIGTFFLNLTISQMQLTDFGICKIIIDGIINYIMWGNDKEGIFRAIQGIGNLTFTQNGQDILNKLKSMPGVTSKLLSYTKQHDNLKLEQCARDISDLLS